MGRFCLSLCVLIAWMARAQDPVGVLEGQIKDPSGAALSAAVVSVTNNQTGVRASQLSANDGGFHFSSLAAGQYDLRVSRQGFASYTASAIHIDIGRTVRIPVTLDIAATRTEVNVTATGATVDLG